MGGTVVGVYYRPPDQEEEVDEAFYRQLEVTSQSQALVVMGDFHHPDICWKGNTARHTQSRMFLQSTDDNFLTQVVEEPTRRGVLLDLVLTNKEGLVGDVKAGGSLGCSDHEMVEFRILRGRSRAISRITTLDFRRANFGLFKDLLGRIPWVRRSWRTGEVPEDWRKANVTPVFKKGKKEDWGNYRPVSLTSIPGKVMEQLILKVINKDVEEKKVIGG
ncbi:hypothetical protein GRJ2_003159700 [Grus japonensis]|uniref:Endonuclease/exonuclease/phosphatase domain-containing protein n=1 Tax=Grus japonensis TaxID=30415 RepID=A0ABC9YBK5_GRUJA